MLLRLIRRNGSGLILLAILAYCASAGCSHALFTALYVMKGQEVEAECKELKGKRVAVVCQPLVSLQFRHANVAKDLAREVGILLKNNVPKLQLVDQAKVAEWMDENYNGDEYLEVGKAVRADMVVGIDLEQFEILAGQTVYQGKAVAAIKVYNCHTGAQVFSKRLSQIVYPPNHVISTVSKPEAEFRREFLQVVAERVARHFYNHDPHADVALDSRAL